MGAEDVTKDISIGMQVDIKEAEEIKRTSWMAVITEGLKSDNQLDLIFLSEIINARYEEIFLKVNQHLERIEKDGRLPGGILLIGGGSKMQNVDYLAKQTFKLATFYGKDLMVNVGDLSLNVQFINLLWVYFWSNKYMDIDSRKTSFKTGKIFNKIWNFFRDLI